MQFHAFIALKQRAGLALAICAALLTAAAPAFSHETGQNVHDGQAKPVVLGTYEPDYQFPWVVSVAGNLTGKGVLISPTWVLTAAHVVHPGFNGVKISYSRRDPVTGIQTGGSQNTGVGSVFIHPDYTLGNAAGDLALVRLPAPFAPDPYLQPAEMPAAAAAVGQMGTVASVSHTMQLPPGQVAVLRSPVLLAGGKTFIGRSPDASLCPGDSGSGFVTKNGEQNVVTGIAVQGALGDCDAPNMEFEAIDVYQYLDWIKATSGVGLQINAEFLTTDGSGGISGLATHEWRKGWDIVVPGNFGGNGATDLLFYDREAGYGEFDTTDGSGGIALLRAQPGWRPVWDLIVPGNFGGDGHTDLLFYDRETGFAQFYATDGGGGIHELATHTNWNDGWDLIVPGHFGGNDATDLLFYDTETGLGLFVATTGDGGFYELRTYTNWSDGWDMIIPGEFGGDGWTDLLFYDKETGGALFVATTGAGRYTELAPQQWNEYWDLILPGNFGGNGSTDLLFYDRETSVGLFVATTGDGGFYELRAAYTDWSTSWDSIVSGDFGGNGWGDVLLYDRTQ